MFLTFCWWRGRIPGVDTDRTSSIAWTRVHAITNQNTCVKYRLSDPSKAATWKRQVRSIVTAIVIVIWKHRTAYLTPCGSSGAPDLHQREYHTIVIGHLLRGRSYSHCGDAWSVGSPSRKRSRSTAYLATSRDGRILIAQTTIVHQIKRDRAIGTILLTWIFIGRQRLRWTHDRGSRSRFDRGLIATGSGLIYREIETTIATKWSSRSHDRSWPSIRSHKQIKRPQKSGENSL